MKRERLEAKSWKTALAAVSLAVSLTGCGLFDAVSNSSSSTSTSPTPIPGSSAASASLDPIGDFLSSREFIGALGTNLIDQTPFDAITKALGDLRIEISSALHLQGSDGCFTPDVSGSRLGLWIREAGCGTSTPLSDAALNLWRSAAIARAYDVEMQKIGVFEQGRQDTYAYYVPGENGWGIVSDSSARNRFNFRAINGLAVCITAATTLSSNDAQVTAGKCP